MLVKEQIPKFGKTRGVNLIKQFSSSLNLRSNKLRLVSGKSFGSCHIICGKAQELWACMQISD